MDRWDGYVAARQRLLGFLRDRRPANPIVLSGDIHTCMALELRVDPFNEAETPVAVEFINTSLTSQNFDDKMKWEPRTKSLPFEQELMKELPHIKYVTLDSHGYNVVDILPERVRVEWWVLDTVLKRSTTERMDAAWQVESGKPRLVRAA